MVYLSPLQASPDDDRDYPYVPVANYPPVLQHRSLVGDIEDQGEIGSCTANSTVSACELLLAKAGTKRHLSRLFNYYVTRELEGRLGQQGAVLRNAVKQAAKLGLPDEAVWAYDTAKAETNPPVEVYQEAAKHKVLRYERIQNGTNDEVAHAIKSAISEGFPVVFGMPVTQQWMNMRGGDTTYRGSAKDPVVGAHAMTIIGYSLDYFVVENSWGKDWGDGGLGYIHRDLVGEFFEAWVIRGFDVEQPVPVPVPVPVPTPAPEPTPAPVPPPAPAKKNDSAGLMIVIAIIVILYLMSLKQ